MCRIAQQEPLQPVTPLCDAPKQTLRVKGEEHFFRDFRQSIPVNATAKSTLRSVSARYRDAPLSNVHIIAGRAL